MYERVWKQFASEQVCIPLNVVMGVFANVSKIETMVKYCKSVFCCCSFKEEEIV